jgi:hypothetical protein
MGDTMAIGDGRAGHIEEGPKRSWLFKLAIGFVIIFVVIPMLGMGLMLSIVQVHRLFETPQERADEDRQVAASELARKQEKKRADEKVAKREWADVSRMYAQQQISRVLKDPESAQFRAITIEDSPTYSPDYPGIACGQVNARNSFGGYTGYKYFIVMGGLPMIEDGGNAFLRLWDKHCVKHQI